MFWYLKNWCRKLHINLKEPHEDAVLRNTNVATPRTVETKCHQYMEPNAIQNYYKYLTLVLFSAPFKHFKWIPFSQVHSRSSNCPYIYTWITIKFANSSRWRCYISHCWIPPWSPSKYSAWEAMHRCQRLIHPSKQFLTETTRNFCQQLMDLASRQCTCSHGTVCEEVFSY